MAYYVLQDGFELCGWKGLPFALCYPNPHFADFFDREDYRLVYWLDGKHDIDQESLTDSQKKLLDRLVERGIAVPSDGMKTLAPWQEYKCYPAMYKNSVQWSITGKCNYKCRHCFMSAPDFKGEDLTMKQVVRILDGLRECGIRSVALTGGEALVHPRFFEILDEIVARNIALETLYTNGELVDARLLDELEKRKLQPAFHLSYDGAGWHDWLRGVDGAEAAVIRAFRLLRERGYQTSVSMCLHRHNIGGLKESIDLLAGEGVCHVKMNVASPTGRWKNERSHFISQDAAFEAIEAYLPQYVADGMPVSAQFCGFIDFNREARKILIPFRKYSGMEGADRAFACGAVKNGMYISPTGKILPCMTLGGTAIDPMFESALEKPLSEILSDSHYYQKWIPLEVVRADCGVSRDGSNMKNVYLAAQSYGLEVHGYRMEVEALKKETSFPCIIHWNFNHFVVLDGFKGDKAVLNDPARGMVQVPMEQFDQSFTGLVLTFKPGEGFTPSGKRKSTLAFARKRLKGAAPAVAFIVLTSIISYLFGIINPVMSRIFFDRLLTGQAPEWLRPFILAMILLAGFQIVVQWAQAVYSLKINGKMAIEGNASFMWKVLKLPMEFFSQRLTGDILQRQGTNASIAGTLVNTVAPLALNTVMMLFYLVVMLRYSAVMTLVGVTSLALNLAVARYLSNKRINLMRVEMRDAGKLASATLAGISMTETIKSSGAEGGFFRKWSGYQASVNTQQVKFATLNARIGLIPQFISTANNYLVLFLGVRLAMSGSFTIGMIVTFQGLLSSFMGPAMTLVNAGQTIQEMRTEMERVEDVMQNPDDPTLQYGADCESKDFAKLSGDLELKHVTFGYSRLGNPIISDFSMHLKQGQRIAIVGASGCGKSTVSKLITGLYQPWAGEILFDGKPISQIPRNVFTGSVAMVDQDIVLFEDTIANNIRMWDDTIEDFEVILAARDAQIHEDILQRPGGYQGRLTENGKDLSGGQRQRIEIARVLAQDPSIIILDEATSALDAKTEYELVKAIKDRGISCIVVAHRLSTIRDCDEIIVLDKGRIVERGTHEELYAKGGAYAELVTSE